MQLLFEEFFKKLNSLGKGSLTIKLIVKIFFVFLVVCLFWIFVYAVINQKYYIIWIIILLYVIVEIAHYIRKSREKIMVSRITEINENKNSNKNILNPEKLKNENLLKINLPKNKNLLRKSRRKKVS